MLTKSKYRSVSRNDGKKIKRLKAKQSRNRNINGNGNNNEFWQADQGTIT